ncbi:hypothetical protein [Microbulbifer litoralis]|uniref:hypothetical protein n=1 Tax=Microbulbifer litoralis TaxID=2933965 RepID=UPI00202989AC|nr:hypothetical protein [Microbulbifer sp. GX H0434]
MKNNKRNTLKPSGLLASVFLGAVLTASGSALAADSSLKKVTLDNYIVAETDGYFSRFLAENPVNSIRHMRDPSGPDNQFVITESRDFLYSHSVVDVSVGATVENPAWDYFSVIEVIDENHYVADVLYPGEKKYFTADQLSAGEHMFLNIRTGIPSLDAEGLEKAHQHQNAIRVHAESATPYPEKKFDAQSLLDVRRQLLPQARGVKETWRAVGGKDVVDPKLHRIATAAGWGGLPVEAAAYIASIQPDAESRSGTCSRMTLPQPPVRAQDGGFFSVSTYDSGSWIVEKNFAVNDREAEANADGSITFHYNCPDQPNNLDVQPGWRQIIRFYLPESPQQIIDYIQAVEQKVAVTPVAQDKG